VIAAAAFLAVAAGSVAGLFEYNFGDKEVLMATLPLIALPFSRGMQRDARERTAPTLAPAPVFEEDRAVRRIQS
jgi:hypothetical protein